MKNPISTIFILVVLFASCKHPGKEQQLKSDFQSATTQYQPRTWWRWLGGNISKEGITKDLEEIKDKGMNGVTLFNLGHYYPKGDVTFMTEEWLNLFDFSVDECERLGLDFSFQMCDGWGASGGPWVSKENAMKVLTSEKTTIEGGKTISMELPMPFHRLDYYQDVKVFAFPAIDTSEHWFNAENVSVNFKGWSVNPEFLIDGNRYTVTNFGFQPGEEKAIYFELNQPRTISEINLHHGDRETPVGPQECEILYSTNGHIYKSITSFTMDDIMGGAKFKPVTAKYFKLKINKWTERSRNGVWAFLSEIELLSPGSVTAFPKLNDFELKASVWHRRRGLEGTKDVNPNLVVEQSKIIDLTENFKNGTLEWDAPEGKWTIVRLGYTLTGRENGPATEEGTGLECDKLSRKAVKQFYDGYAGKLLIRNAEHCGKTISRLFADSFEALAQNWTDDMIAEFKNRAGYDPTPYLLVFSGEVVDNAEVTERFLFDYRKVLSEMIADNYYAYLNELCHQNNVEFVAQIAGEQQMLANPILYASKVDYPATEFWIGGKFHDTYFHPNGSVFDAISASHIYGKDFIPTESFTMNYSDFSVTPATLKPIGDKAFCYGINQFEMHTYIHQPDDKLPGWQHYMFGIAWGRKITWWEHAGQLTNYFTRVQSILQKGIPNADILIYTGEQIPNSIEFAYNIHKPEDLLPFGYGYDIINSYELIKTLSVKDGVFYLPNGLNYKLLVLPPHEYMSLEVLQKIEEFAKNGGIILGTKPSKSYGLTNYNENDELVANLVNEIWKYSNVYTDDPIQKVLTENNIHPDFSFTTENKGVNILFNHNTIDDTDTYFISNQSGRPIEIQASFRQSGKTPQLWHPETGEIKTINDFETNGARTQMSLDFGSMESYFVVFTPENYTEYTLKSEPKVVYDKINLNHNWTVSFDSDWGAPNEITFDSLYSWTNHKLEGIKYYSGTAVYSRSFELINTHVQADSKIILDLGAVGDIAEVYINGKRTGAILFPDYIFDITDFVKEGENKIEIRVTNTWNNRIAGDDLHPEKERFTFYPVKGYNPNVERREYNDNDLLESGLMGPVEVRLLK